MMELINQKVKLSDLAAALGVTSSAVRQHLASNKSGLAEDSEKFGNRMTGDHLLAIPSVLNFLSWLRSKGRKVKQEDIDKTENIVMSLWKVLS